MEDIVEHCYKKFSDIIEKKKLFDNIESFLILFSCGKDCSVMLDLFHRYYKEHNLKQTITIFSTLFPKHMYYKSPGFPNDNFNEIISYWNNRSINIKYETPNFDDFDDNDIHGCKICKSSRKQVIDKYVNLFSGNIGLLTGFTIQDALAYLNMLLLTCNFDISNLNKLSAIERDTTTKMLHKMSLKEHLPNGKYMIRPMLPFYEDEIRRYLQVKRIPYLTTPCKITKYKFKRLYGNAISLYNPCPVTYDGIETFLLKQGIKLNDNGLSFNDVQNDNYFIDC